MKILFAGGGTLGPVTPLLAVAEAWKAVDPRTTFAWAGTPSGPERSVVEAAGIPFASIPVFRLTRYPSLEWLLLPLHLMSSFVAAWQMIGRQRPDLVATAGGYTGVPLVWVARMRGIPCWIHQQDATTLLSTRLTAPFASCVTVAWKHLSDPVHPHKAEWIGNPVRPSVLKGDKERAIRTFGLDATKPTVLVFGGGGGAVWLNRAFEQMGGRIAEEANVIHVTGTGKRSVVLQGFGGRYHAVELLTDGMADAYAVADVVVARAGMGTLTELAACEKPAILVPLPDSPQERNAHILAEASAAVVIDQKTSTPDALAHVLLELLRDAKRRDQLSRRVTGVLPTDVSEQMIRHVLRHAGLMH